MDPQDNAPVTYIDTPRGLSRWVKVLEKADEIGVDTEGDSMHHYRERVCLIQMTAMGQDVIIDPLALPDLSSLTDVFADDQKIKIFHDACYDLIGLRRDFGFEVAGIFDTMLACRFLGYARFGLAAQLKECFDHEADKRFQRSDWTRRPLSEEQITYARYDTHYLPALRAHLSESLEKAGRLAWAEEDFTRLPEQTRSMAGRAIGEDLDRGFWRVRGVKALLPIQKGRVQKLHALRDAVAQALDRPPFRVISDMVMLQLAMDPPKTPDDIAPRRGLSRTLMDRYRQDVFDVITQAEPLYGKPPQGSGRRRVGRPSDPELRSRFDKLRDLRRKVASGLGLDPEVLLGNAALDILTRKPPTSMDDLKSRLDLGIWRQPLLAVPIVECFRQTEVPQTTEES